jgi:hypothetical protein
MMMYMFDAISVLKKQLPSNQQLEITHSGYVWKASFRWSEPATTEITRDVNASFNNWLAKDYIEFLEQISNGVVLYYDSEFGQWGFELYGTDKLFAKQKFWQKSIPIKWESYFIAFGEIFGEANALVFDLSKPSTNQDSYSVLEASAIDPIDYWPLASRSFHEWIDHLITAQGDKYWIWL